MAIYHLSMKPISRSSGRSAVAAAAYRAAECLTNERDGLTHDFTRREGVEHAEIVLAKGVDAEWARERAALWNAAEQVENRKDARVAREFEIALPHELNADLRLEATRTFAQGLADRYGTAVDFAIHSPHGDTDVRNHHAHLMMTVRKIGPEGFLDKTEIERENKWLLSKDMATSQMQLRELRQSWEQIANERLTGVGLDMRIDHRSHSERGLEIEPTEHMGVQATQMQRRGMSVTRVRLDAEAAQRNAELIREKPEQVLDLLTGEKSVFDRHDIARALHRYVDQPEAFQAAFAKVMTSAALVELQPERVDAQGEVELARYSTREMVEIERGMADGAARMAERQGFGVDGRHVEAALEVQSQAIRRSAAGSAAGPVAIGEGGREGEAVGVSSVPSAAGLTDEQRRAVEHVTGPEQVAVVVGLAGAGKSTMLAAAREAWTAQGFTVHGAALSGKAAEGLEESSGIASRTLASWDYGWKAGRSELGPKDVLVIDEAGMVGSRQLARFVGEAERTGAKIVLVGDHEQLQAIGAGAPFRAIAERVGFAELSEVRRQRQDWQREASQAFARHRTAEGLQSYSEHGAVTFAGTRDEARAEIVRDYMADLEQRPEGSRVAMAHRRVDVRALNEDIRAARMQAGHLARGDRGAGEGALGGGEGERIFETDNGPRAFAAGDRIVFLENNRDLGVKNGMLGTVAEIDEGRIVAKLDGKGRDGNERIIAVSVEDYAAIDHGYATTIHKTQGATVDRAFVMASGTMDRHLTYVAMTRHRDEARLYAAREEFKGRGAEQTPAEALAARLSRDGSKETTLDYAQDYAERRGIAERFGVRSEIQVTRANEGRAAGREGERAPAGAAVLLEEAHAKRQPEERQAPAKKRGMFAGLKLGAREQKAEDGQKLAEQAQGKPRGVFEGLKLPAGERSEAFRKPEAYKPDALALAVEAYAKAFTDAARMSGLGLPVVEHQKAAMETTSAAMEAARPGSLRDLTSAVRHDPETRRVLTQTQGEERAEGLIAGMERERQARLDPDVRAERLATRWNALEAEEAKLGARAHAERQGADIEARLRAVAEEIAKDEEAQSAMRQRSRELGIGERSRLGRALKQDDVPKALEQGITRGQRERGHGQSM